MKEVFKKYFNVKKLLLLLGGGLSFSIAVNYFIIPVDLYTGGLTGLLLIFNTLIGNKIDFALLYLLANIPLLLLSWFKLGKRFTFYTVFNVLSFSFFTAILPDIKQISDDRLIMALFGGGFSGVGVVLSLLAGGSGGGIDILALYYSERTGKPLGQFALLINVIVLSLTAILFNLEIALYTMIGSYVTSIVIDKFHTRYRKLTVTVNTSNPDEFIEEFKMKSTRGLTIIPAKGAYTMQDRKLLYVVITSYELTPFLELVKKHDENAFVNITKSERVFGNFNTISIDDI